MRDAWGEVTDKEIWAVANHVLTQHGDQGGRVFIAARIGELAVRGDAAGIATWRLIAARFESIGAASHQAIQ